MSCLQEVGRKLDQDKGSGVESRPSMDLDALVAMTPEEASMSKAEAPGPDVVKTKIQSIRICFGRAASVLQSIPEDDLGEGSGSKSSMHEVLQASEDQDLFTGGNFESAPGEAQTLTSHTSSDHISGQMGLVHSVAQAGAASFRLSKWSIICHTDIHVALQHNIGSHLAHLYCGVQPSCTSLHCIGWRVFQVFSELLEVILMRMQVADSQPAEAGAEDELPRKAMPAATKKRGVCCPPCVLKRCAGG